MVAKKFILFFQLVPSRMQHILSFYRSWRKLVSGAGTGWSCTGAPQRLLEQQRFNGSSWSWCKGIMSHWRQRFNKRWRSTLAEVRCPFVTYMLLPTSYCAYSAQHYVVGQVKLPKFWISPLKFFRWSTWSGTSFNVDVWPLWELKLQYKPKDLINPFDYNSLILVLEQAYMVCPTTFIVKILK